MRVGCAAIGASTVAVASRVVSGKLTASEVFRAKDTLSRLALP
jgi:hypothetical protein